MRSIGGGETWDQFVGTSAQIGDNTEDGLTVGQALARREITSKATAGQDYQVLDTTLQFKVDLFA